MLKKNAFKKYKPAGLEIERDDAGVPYIKANSFKDALWGSGYAHGIDRGTQLLLIRILGQGRLCELLADDDASLQIDLFFRKANWHNNLDAEVAKLDSESKALCQTYCDGLNFALGKKKLSIIKLLGCPLETWQIKDTILLSRMISYLTLAQSQTEVEKFFVELVQAGIATEQLAELFPIDLNNFDRSLCEDVALQESLVPKEIIWNLALPRMMASNNWVISGKKTSSGAPILANDPHLEINRLPNVWCEQNLQWDDQFLSGMGMPGIPGTIIGRSQSIAWGTTYAFMDSVDSWVEDCREGQFRRGDQWQDFKIRKEVISRKKNEDYTVSFYENMHGVLEGNPHKNGKYLATRWIAATSGAQTLMTSFRLTGAKTTKEAMQHLSLFESAWNWVIADQNNNIGYQMSGLMPLRHPKWNGFTPAPGWDLSFDWQGIVSPKDLPQSFNPECGYIVTANNDLNHLGIASPINMPMGDYRAKRIEALLQADSKHTIDSMKAIQMDVYSNQAKQFLSILRPLLEAKNEKSEIYNILKNWDCRYNYESIGAPIFETFYSALRLEVFGAGKYALGTSVVSHLEEQTGLFIDFYQNFDKILLNKNSLWYQESSCEQAFLNAFATLHHEKERKNKQWQEINKISFINILLQGKAPNFMGFDRLDIPLQGGRATPHQGQIYKSAGRQTSFGPSVRVIADLKDNNLHTCLAGGPSDNAFSKWYTSELDNWRTGEYKILSP